MSVYAAEVPRHLELALQSIWDNQTLKPNEIVLVEDGPLGPELSAVVTKWSKRLGAGFILVKNECNIGLTKSLNRGLSFTSCEYIARMDSDDISDSRRFERQVAFLDNHPDIDILGGYIQEFDEKKLLGIRKYPLNHDDIKKYISKANPFAHSTVMMRRRIFSSGIRYDERYRTNQDLALWFRLLCLGYRMANLPCVTLNFRLSDGVLKRRSRKSAMRELNIYVKGIYQLNGLFSWQYIYPFARFIFRLMPTSIARYIYNSSIRSKL